MRLSVIGCGYLGAVHAAAMASIGHEVVGIDVDARKIDSLSRGEAPFFEPGLQEILTAGIDGVYPRGVSIGTVVKAEPGESLFKTVQVKPSVDFRTLEEVIVIHTRKIPTSVVRYAP